MTTLPTFAAVAPSMIGLTMIGGGIVVLRKCDIPTKILYPTIKEGVIAVVAGIALYAMLNVVLGYASSDSISLIDSLTMGLIGPIWEELIFRNLLLELSFRYGFPIGGIIVTSALFAALHAPVNGLESAVYFSGGVLLAGLYVWRQNILVPIIAHIVANCLAVADGW